MADIDREDLKRWLDAREKDLQIDEQKPGHLPTHWSVQSDGMTAFAAAAQAYLDMDEQLKQAREAGFKAGELSMDGRFTYNQAADVKAIAENAKAGGYKDGYKIGHLEGQGLVVKAILKMSDILGADS